MHLNFKLIELNKREEVPDISPPKPLDKSSQIKKVDHLNPLVVSILCVRLVHVNDFLWEEDENIFLINLRKLHNKTSSKISNSLNITMGAIQNRTLFETLPISLRIEYKAERVDIGKKNLRGKKQVIRPVISKYFIQKMLWLIYAAECTLIYHF